MGKLLHDTSNMSTFFDNTLFLAFQSEKIAIQMGSISQKRRAQSTRNRTVGVNKEGKYQ